MRIVLDENSTREEFKSSGYACLLLGACIIPVTIEGTLGLFEVDSLDWLIPTVLWFCFGVCLVGAGIQRLGCAHDMPKDDEDYCEASYWVNFTVYLIIAAVVIALLYLQLIDLLISVNSIIFDFVIVAVFFTFRAAGQAYQALNARGRY